MTAKPWPRRATCVAAVLGTLGMTLIARAGATLGPTGPATSLLGGVGDDSLHSPLAVVLAVSMLVTGLVLAFGSWLYVGLVLRRGASLRPLVAIASAWTIPLLVGPVVYSRDVYSYAALGRMALMHLNPYRVGPATLGNSPYVTGVSAAWRHTPSPYGPGFIALCRTLDRIAGPSVTSAVFLLRLVEVLGLVLAAVSLPRLAVRVNKDPARALWLGICNPFVLVHCIGGAHNEAIMIGLILAGLALADANHHVAGVLCCIAAASIKAPAVVAVGFVILDATRDEPTYQRVVTALRLSAVGATAFAFVTWISGVGYGWLHALSVPGSNHLLLTPTTLVAQVTSDVVAHDGFILGATRAIGWLVVTAAVAYLLTRSPRIGVVRACGLALAAVIVFGPILLPWYALWAIILLAAAGHRIERGLAILASILLMVSVQPSGSAMPDVWLAATVVALTASIVLIGTPSVRAWIRYDLAVALDEFRASEHTARVRDIPRRALARQRLATPATRST